MKKTAAVMTALSLMAGYTACMAAEGSFTLSMQIGNPVMTVNGAEKNIDDEGTAPVIVNERTLVPIRAIIEAAGGEVSWDGDTRRVTLGYNGSTIELVIDSQTAYLNGAASELDTAPAIINERTMLPIRYVAESFGFSVGWDGDTQTIRISQSPVVIEVGDVKVRMNDIAAFLSDDNFEYYEEYFDDYKEYIVNSVASSMKYGELAKVSGFTLQEREKDEIEQEINEAADYFENLGASKDTIYKILEASECANMLFEHISAEIPEPSDAEIKEFFINNYYRAKHILVEDEALAKDILEQAKNGADFDTLIAEYNADPGMTSNPDGYIFTDGMMVEEFEDCVKSLEPGGLGLCETMYGWHVIERLPLTEDEDKFTDWFAANSEDIAQEAMTEDELYKRLDALCEENGIETKINWDVVNEFTIEDLQ